VQAQLGNGPDLTFDFTVSVKEANGHDFPSLLALLSKASQGTASLILTLATTPDKPEPCGAAAWRFFFRKLLSKTRYPMKVILSGPALSLAEMRLANLFGNGETFRRMVRGQAV
jgi:hypothetical protein